MSRQITITKDGESVYELKSSRDSLDAYDGFHTLTELYEFRKLYNAALFNEWAWQGAQYGGALQPIKSKRHSDGDLCFGGGWFIVVAQLPDGQISNHYEMDDWDLFQIPEAEKAPQWDGHTPQDVAVRLRAYLEKMK